MLSAGTAPAGAVCIEGVPLEGLAQVYPLIFEGEVTALPGEVVLGDEDLPYPYVGLRVRLTVARVWQGDPGEAIEIAYTDHTGQMRGRFNLRERFVVWAEKHDGRWLTSDCAPTIERDLASPEMLAFLAKLKK